MSIFEYERDAVRVKAKCIKLSGLEENRKFSIDPNLTSFEILRSLLTRAFDVGDHFCISFISSDDEWLPLLSDWDLDAAIISSSDPFLSLKIAESDRKGFVEEAATASVHYFKKKVEKTLPSITQRFQRALIVAEESLLKSSSSSLSSHHNFQYSNSVMGRNSPLADKEFQNFKDGVGELTHPRELRLAVYQGGIEPPLRKVVWKHILGVYPKGLNGKQRISYIKDKSREYHALKKTWTDIMLQGTMTDQIKLITNMVKKDVFRTDRHHSFFAGEENKNVNILFNILTTYALNHPSVGYCQGMSDLLAPLLVIMLDEPQSYIVFCALMKRLKNNFLSDGKSMTKKFNHLSEGIMFYDPEFFAYLKLHGADDLLFCYRWLLLEMKREFSFEDSCRVLEVLWSSLPPSHPEEEDGLPLYEVKFEDISSTQVPTVKKISDTPYARVAALRKRTGSSDASLGDKISQHAKIGHKNLSLATEGCRPRIQSDGSVNDRIRKVDYDLMTKSVSADKVKKVVKDLHDFYKLASVKSGNNTNSSNITATTTNNGNNSNSTDAHQQFSHSTSKISTSSESEKSEGGDNTNHSNEETSTVPDKMSDIEELNSSSTVALIDPFDPNEVGYSQANGSNLSIVCKRLPPPTDFGDGNPFLMFLCISILIQHRGHILSHKFDYQEIAMYFDRLIRRHNVEKTLHIARKLFAEYLNEDWSLSETNSSEQFNNAC
uniref:TBC1 domain family member 25like [Nasonia vitripennis] n=1 Tax=Lepeophtheirus salmonis TaxID=72036 RepID=A0A0K2TQC7_LEPSM